MSEREKLARLMHVLAAQYCEGNPDHGAQMYPWEELKGKYRRQYRRVAAGLLAAGYEQIVPLVLAGEES